MTSEHVIQRIVEFAETDMAGIVHFSRYANYMEAAEHDLFRSVGLSIVTEIDGRQYGWPRVHVECAWRSPLRFEDIFDVHLFIREIRSKAILYDFAFLKHTGSSDTDRQLVGHGSFTTVCVTEEPDGTHRAVDIPDAVRERLEPVAPDRLAEFFPNAND